LSAPVRSALCEGFVSHRRAGGPAHAFRYPVFLTLLDLDELGALSSRLRLFGCERRRPLSFHERDHLAGSGRGLRAELAEAVRAEGHALPAGRVELLTHCRVFGHVFNPVSFFYCYDADERLALVVAEVNNTFGDRHCYVLPVVDGGFAWSRKKLLHVSPFQQPDAGTYLFELPPPGELVEAAIDLTRGGETLLGARLRLSRRLPLTDAAIASALLRYPLMTLQVVAAIHFEALRLWWKGAPFFPRPPYDPAAARGGPA
jgi:DUF1365 family protein